MSYAHDFNDRVKIDQEIRAKRRAPPPRAAGRARPEPSILRAPAVANRALTCAAVMPTQEPKGDRMSRMENAGQGQGGISQSAADVQQNIRDMGGQIKDAATEKYSQLRDQAQDYYEQGRQQAMEWEQGLEDYVRQKPLQSLMIAAGVGMLLGIIWKRS
jgi:ElaB/YqjD/DUF883 family membrane-anchored ribosome-binding protein